MEFVYEDIELKLFEYIDNIKDWSPYYIFSIYIKGKNEEIGRIVFRLGDDREHEYAGHIGYSIEKCYQGHYYAYKACKSLLPFIKSQGYSHVLITCSPENIASKKTIEKLGCHFLGMKTIPHHLRKNFAVGETEKCIYSLDIE